jgi:hypothetical protein
VSPFFLFLKWGRRVGLLIFTEGGRVICALTQTFYSPPYSKPRHAQNTCWGVYLLTTGIHRVGYGMMVSQQSMAACWGMVTALAVSDPYCRGYIPCVGVTVCHILGPDHTTFAYNPFSLPYPTRQLSLVSSSPFSPPFSPPPSLPLLPSHF